MAESASQNSANVGSSVTNATSSSAAQCGAAQCGLHNRRVAFCPSLRVILIPSRGEYKRAGLYGELWWASIDFLQFQAAANSEIRMLASYEGIGAKAARCKLYQPGANSIDPDEFLAFVGGGFSGNPFDRSPASSAKPSPNASDENLDKKSNIVGDEDKESQAGGGGGAGEDEAFGQFAETDGAEVEADEQPPFSPSPHQSHSATPPASSSYSTSSSSSSSSSRPRFGSSGSEDDAKGGGLDDDDDESPQMVRVNSLDCVKSALRVPLPETLEEDGASIWTWNGKLKSPPSPSSSSSSSTLARRAGGGSTAALAAAAQKHDKSSSRLASSSSSSSSFSSSSQQPRGQEEHEFWRLCVSMDKPNGLNGERKSRFSCRSTNGGHESGVGFTTLVMWIGAFFVVAYLVLDSGSSAIHHDPSSTVTKM